MTKLSANFALYGFQISGINGLAIAARAPSQYARLLAIGAVMNLCDGVQIKAAARLGINRNTLHKKLKEYGLDDAEGE